MTKAVQNMKTQLKQLSQEERAELAHFLLESLEPEEEGAAAAWDAEIARRMSEIRSGSATGKPAEQVFAVLDAQSCQP
jgi:putative addiction module component (TIGR02574 family)